MAQNLRAAFFVVTLLEEKGYDGPRHCDADDYRNRGLRIASKFLL